MLVSLFSGPKLLPHLCFSNVLENRKDSTDCGTVMRSFPENVSSSLPGLVPRLPQDSAEAALPGAGHRSHAAAAAAAAALGRQVGAHAEAGVVAMVCKWRKEKESDRK